MGGEMPRVCDKMSKFESKTREMKVLHRVLYGADGAVTMRKRQIRQFCGLSKEDFSASEKRLNALETKDIVCVQQLLDIKNRGATKADKVQCTLEFLKNPTIQHGTAAKKKATKKATPKKKKAKKARPWRRRKRQPKKK